MTQTRGRTAASAQAKDPPEVSSAAAVPEAATTGDKDDLLEILTEIVTAEKSVLHSADQTRALVSSNITSQHKKRAASIEDSFVEWLSKVGESCGFAQTDIYLPVIFLFTHFRHFFNFKNSYGRWEAKMGIFARGSS